MLTSMRMQIEVSLKTSNIQYVQIIRGILLPAPLLGVGVG